MNLLSDQQVRAATIAPLDDGEVTALENGLRRLILALDPRHSR